MASFDQMFEEVKEWIRIPSISSGGGDPNDLTRAAEWARDKITAAGGEATIETGFGNPIVVGELRANRPDAPTVMIYGHLDVQSADPIELWDTPPFEPTVKGDRVYARGTSDDKGNFYPLLFEAAGMSKAGELPVNVRVLIEADEETGGMGVVDWLRQDDRGADAAIIFDSDMLDADTPALTLGVRGIVQGGIEVRTASADLHSGMFGGSVLNAAHVLLQVISAVLPGEDGRLRAELREGILEPTKEELEAWSQFPSGDSLIAQMRAQPLHERAGAEYYERNWADASIDVHGIATGDAEQVRTQVPSTAKAKLSMRLAPGQTTERMKVVLKELIEAAAPPGAEVTYTCIATGEPAVFDPKDAALELAAEAFTEACGKPPALQRVGGSLPVMAGFYDKGIPVICSGFALPEDGVHGPNESFRLESLRLCQVTAAALYRKLAELPTS